MSDVLTFSDFWFLSLIPIVLQSVAIGYLWKIRMFIGRRTTQILTIKNLALLSLYIVTTVILVEANSIQGAQPIETWGVLADFGLPMIVSTMFFLHLREMKYALFPNSSPVDKAKKQSEERDIKRDVKRDITRDYERDLTRDIPRDISRDINRDRDRDRNRNRKKDNNNNNNNNNNTS